ncbi:hypothetical protein GJ496_002548, partial [Pomphorhynchus laevis]
LLELLYRLKWTNRDGLAALIISPTRELAYQIFNVLKIVGKYHDFSCGLVIGGKSLEEEVKAIDRTNIVICTPGRLLQHMDETWNFSADNLKMLVLDEADRILDLGFTPTMKAIISHLPKCRQTLLFSATQTRSVSALVALSLTDPIFVSANEEQKNVTPDKLEQFYIVLDEIQKVNFIWSFIKQHRQKILVFLQCCKQVRFFGACFKKMRPGVPVYSLCGRMGQPKRLSVFDMFCDKGFGVLFATDVAARGLDIPQVDWVIQLDCCSDPDTYIHRVGRTARFSEGGKSILVVRPSEIPMIKQLKQRFIPISKIEVEEDMIIDINQRVKIEIAADKDLLECAKKAFLVYLKSLKKMPDKKTFQMESVDFEKLAKSYGIPQIPRVRFMQKSKENERCQASAHISKRNIEVNANDAYVSDADGSLSADDLPSEDQIDDILDLPDSKVFASALSDIYVIGQEEHKQYQLEQKLKSKNLKNERKRTVDQSDDVESD